MNQDVMEDQYLELVPAYALEALTQSEARAFEEHLEQGCEVCQRELQGYESTVLALSLEAPPVNPPERLRDLLLERVSAEAAEHKQHALPSIDPDLITICANEGTWRETGDEGVLVKPLFFDEENGLVTTLMKLAPGARLPMHRHKGTEQCYVLEGDVLAASKRLGPGDFHVAMERSVHPPLESVEGAMLLLVSPVEYEVIA
jgi:quercetin dioxygenase-like cupin family protein